MLPDVLPPSEPLLPPPLALSEQIARFRGRHFDYLLWLIAHPSDLYANGERALGLPSNTLYRWRRDTVGYKETIEAIKRYRGDLRVEAARVLFHKATIPVSEAMVARAQGDGPTAQRAAERILETVGVLRKENDLAAGMEAIDLVVLKMRRNISPI